MAGGDGREGGGGSELGVWVGGGSCCCCCWVGWGGL